MNHNPRNRLNVPDEFEAEALAAFDGPERAEEYYGMGTYQGQRVFRYVAPMTIQESCLTCHGQPAGELDMTGNAKEGWSVGDVGGAMSIIVPVDLYDQARRDDTVRNALFFVLLTAVSVGIVFLGLSHLVVRPLKKIERGVESMSADYRPVELGGAQSSSETLHIVERLNHTARELSELRRDLERKVDVRTKSLNEANALLERSRDELAAANEQLRSQNAYKSQFLSMMSHELRTPLTSITASAALLAKRLGEGGGEAAAGAGAGVGGTGVDAAKGASDRARDQEILREIEGSCAHAAHPHQRHSGDGSSGGGTGHFRAGASGRGRRGAGRARNHRAARPREGPAVQLLGGARRAASGGRFREAAPHAGEPAVQRREVH